MMADNQTIPKQDDFVEQEKQIQTMTVLSTMTEDFEYIAAVNIKDKTVSSFWTSEKHKAARQAIKDDLPSNMQLDQFFHFIVHPDDMKMFREKSNINVCMAELEKHPNYKFEFRTLYEGRDCLLYTSPSPRDS